MGLCLKVKIIAGCTIEEAAVELTNLRLALPKQISLVEADFNGFCMIAGPLSTPNNLVGEYNQHLKRRKKT